MSIACLLRFRIDPTQRTAFAIYADLCRRLSAECGGAPLGFYLPHQPDGRAAAGLVAFESVSAYRDCRRALRAHPEAAAALAFARAHGFVHATERRLLAPLPSLGAGDAAP